MATESIVYLSAVRHETEKNGRNVWQLGYSVPTAAGYLPPLPRNAAFAVAREIHGDSVRVCIR